MNFKPWKKGNKTTVVKAIENRKLLPGYDKLNADGKIKLISKERERLKIESAKLKTENNAILIENEKISMKIKLVVVSLAAVAGLTAMYGLKQLEEIATVDDKAEMLERRIENSKNINKYFSNLGDTLSINNDEKWILEGEENGIQTYRPLEKYNKVEIWEIEDGPIFE